MSVVPVPVPVPVSHRHSGQVIENTWRCLTMVSWACSKQAARCHAASRASCRGMNQKFANAHENSSKKETNLNFCYIDNVAKGNLLIAMAGDVALRDIDTLVSREPDTLYQMYETMRAPQSKQTAGLADRCSNSASSEAKINSGEYHVSDL